MNASIVSAPQPVVRKSGGRLITIPLAAGATVTLTSQGSKFYFVISTGPVNAKPRGKEFGAGDYVLYPQEGTGFEGTDDNPFDFVDIQNPNSFAVVLAVWIGFSGFIDNRLIVNNLTNPAVVYPTYAVASTASTITFTDLSGTVFTDANGNQWIAISRMAIQFFNLDTGTTFLLTNLAGTKAVAAFPPAPLPISQPISGNYKVVSGGSIDAIASEIYSAIPYVP